MAQTFNSLTDQTVIDHLMNGNIGVIPTDTIYGIVCKALNAQSVDRLTEIRKRDLDKPFIILIGSIDDLITFFADITPNIRQYLDSVWPGAVSVIVDAPHPDLEYLHRGTDTLAFRLPNDEHVLKLLQTVGPLVAPSANLPGVPHAKTIEEAKQYFGDNIDFYVEAGIIEGAPSKLVKIEGNDIKVLRD